MDPLTLELTSYHLIAKVPSVDRRHDRAAQSIDDLLDNVILWSESELQISNVATLDRRGCK